MPHDERRLLALPISSLLAPASPEIEESEGPLRTLFGFFVGWAVWSAECVSSFVGSLLWDWLWWGLSVGFDSLVLWLLDKCGSVCAGLFLVVKILIGVGAAAVLIFLGYLGYRFLVLGRLPVSGADRPLPGADRGSFELRPRPHPLGG